MGKNQSYSYSLTMMLAPYVVVGALWIPTSKYVERHEPDLLLSQAIVDCIATVVVFAQSVAVGNSSIYDPYWHVVPMFFTAYWALGSATPWVVIVPYLYCLKQDQSYFRFWPGLSYEDYRYVEFQQKFAFSKPFYWVFSFLSFHLFPTVLVYLGYTPLYFAMIETSERNDLVFYAGIATSLLSVLIQFIADWQLYPYRTKQKKGDCDEGIWRYCRHPNYFGECFFWWGQYVAALSYGLRYYWTGIGALGVQLMFVLYSIPSMEKHLVEKRPSYRKYQQEVSCFFPWFRKASKLK